MIAGAYEQTHAPAYKTRDWHACNEALKRRGSLAIPWPAGDRPQSPKGWFDTAMTWEAARKGKRGRQPDDSDAAIQTSRRARMPNPGNPTRPGRSPPS